MINFSKTIIGVNIIINIAYILIFSILDLVMRNNLSANTTEINNEPCIPILLGMGFIALFALVQFCANFVVGFWNYFINENKQKSKNYLLSAFIVFTITVLFFWIFLETFIGGVKSE